MSFKNLSEHQILALALDEWLMGLDDDAWEKALNHIELRKRQRSMRKKDESNSQELGSDKDNRKKISNSLY